jgi:hypothetical protein
MKKAVFTRAKARVPCSSCLRAEVIFHPGDDRGFVAAKRS